MLHVTDGRMLVWRQINTVYTPRNIQPTVPYGGGSIMIWVVSFIIASWTWSPYQEAGDQYRQLNLLLKKYVNWKQNCIGNGGSYHSRTPDDWLEGLDGELRPSSKHVVVSRDTELWNMDVVKWFVIDVFQMKWQSYCALWTAKVNA